jgi:hypothetical protein
MLDPPEPLKSLWDGTNPRSAEFRKHARKYNSAFAFASFQYGERGGPGPRRGIQTFQIQGAVYHLQGPLGPAPADKEPRFAQLYFYEPEEANNFRQRHYDLDPWITGRIRDVLEEHNPFQRRFVTAFDMLREFTGEASLILDPQLKLVIDPGKDQRRYNLPTVNEVMAIIPDEWSDPSVRDVILFHRNEDGSLSQSFERISRSHPSYLPLHYVLLFPHGSPGWHFNMPCRPNDGAAAGRGAADMDVDEDEDEDGSGDNKHLTQRDWYRYYLFDRVDQFSAFLRAGRLFEQFVEDAWGSIEQEMLDWHRRNQDTIRAELYTGIMDALAGDFEPTNIGQPVILPPSYRHGDRFMSKTYQVSLLSQKQDFLLISLY